MSRRSISIKDKLDTFHLEFTTKELVDSVDDNIVSHPEASVQSNGKRAWFHGDRPKCIDQLDRQLKRRFGIKSERSVVCLYSPPEKTENGYKEKNLTINENKGDVIHRVVISTIHETVDVTFGTAFPETLEMKQWVAYKTPDMVGGVLQYRFSNDRRLIIPPKKGFRQVRKTKKLDERYIIVFDYLISKDEMKEIQNLLEKKGMKTDDGDLDEAMKALRS